jgi:quercetin dioxygenase-like cupin family protein
MRKTKLAVAFLFAAIPFAAPAMDFLAAPDAVKWGAAPPALPPGAQLSVLSGDPSKEGPYVLPARLPVGYTVPPHTHPSDENVTVISGAFHVAMGDKLDKTKGDALKPGGFFRAEKGMQHYAWATARTIIQIHGIGPFAINYVNSGDDPRNKPTAQNKPATMGKQ